MDTALDAAKRGPWLVELDAVDPDAHPSVYSRTLICHSYDGTAAGAEHWAADVLDWCQVTVRSVVRVRGQLLEAREDPYRLDDQRPAPARNQHTGMALDARADQLVRELAREAGPCLVTVAGFRARRQEVRQQLEWGASEIDIADALATAPELPLTEALMIQAEVKRLEPEQ
jgi:hypothetical protein